ncbi:MAG: hypothetical protein PHQ23_09855, partial [Candidatus Wallbacteria bacterium]|nr:hypothetical protein [Candidatus Wallbacteria bacterium]
MKHLTGVALLTLRSIFKGAFWFLSLGACAFFVLFYFYTTSMTEELPDRLLRDLMLSLRSIVAFLAVLLLSAVDFPEELRT